jgi:hypothetical protein
MGRLWADRIGIGLAWPLEQSGRSSACARSTW